MALNLLDSYGRRGVSYGLFTRPADIIDTDYLSKFFVVSEFSPTFTSGRNAISLNGSSMLESGSEILIECIDSAGNNLFIEMATTISGARTYAYKEATAFVFSIHVYNDTADGVGKLILYGTLKNGQSVKWARNVTVDKTQQNGSRVRFYNRPLLEVDAVLVPILASSAGTTLKTSITFQGSAYGLAVTPAKDTILPVVNRRNVDTDYRMTVSYPVITKDTFVYQSINSQMIGASVDINPITIQYPLTSDLLTLNPPPTQSYIITDVVNDTTFKLSDPYFYKDGKGNQTITNIVDSTFTITYPYISYNTATSSYQQTNINGVLTTMYNSYADITYRNIRTFSGYLARHKLYRKSLLSNADFSIVADEPLFINELLKDNLTQNKYYDLLGKFYNQDHINRYWFTSSNNLYLTHSGEVYIDSARMSSPNYTSLIGNDYLMVKNDSTANNRNAQYIPHDPSQFIATSGSAYDSNFMELKAGVQYIIQVSAVLEKNSDEDDAKLEFYFTSSVPDARKDTNFNHVHGIKMATLLSNQIGLSNRVYDDVVFFYTPPYDLFGTMVIVPYRCQSYLKKISFRVYGDDGFSPDVFTTRIPWEITVANETYQIRAELFDINHNLVYSDLTAVQNFDPSGSSLTPFISSDGSGTVIGEGDLVLDVGNIFIPNISNRPETSLISASRFVSVRGDAAFPGQLVRNRIVEVGHTADHIFISTGSYTINPSNMSANHVSMRQAIASSYAAQIGGRIYYSGTTKTVERPSGY